MDGFWTKNTTWCTRYDDFGATGYMLLHVKGMEDAVIIDVGCSTGEAMKESKLCLSKHGVKLHAIGIDMADKAKLIAEAENNLDKFVNKSVFNVDEYIGRADVVVCLNTIRNVLGGTKSGIIKKCAGFLKPGGVLITDVGKEYRDMLKLEEPASSQPKRVCAGWGWWTLGCRRSDTRMMKRDGALHYAGMIQADWDKMGNLHKKIARFHNDVGRWISNHILR